MSQTSQVYAHLNEPAEKPEASRFSEAVSRSSDYVRHQTSQIRMPEFIMAFLLLFGDAVPGLGLPFNQVVILVLAAYGLTRKPTFDVSHFSGLVYCLFGLLILSFARNKFEVIGAIVVFSGLLWATGSRTSIAAYVAGLIWIVIANRLKTFGRIALGVALYWLIDILTSDYAQSGVFADRTGTDALRSLIDQASEIKVQASGFFGQGLGEAYVYLAHTGSKTWFFHNSYWSALVEGGWPWMILVVTITLLFIVNVFSGQKTLPTKFYVVQGAGVAIMICASRLGEVFYTWPWAVTCGLALRVLLIEREQRLGTGHDEASIEGFDERIEIRDAEEADNHVLATQNIHKA